jgi:4'-phosphopantetheinyl transferase
LKSASPDARGAQLRAPFHPLLQRMESPESGVEIWRAHLDSASLEEIANLRRLLDANENQRAENFRLERDRHRFVVAHGLLRHLLSRTLNRTDIAFTYGINGKPALTQNDGLQFNLAHSADWAVFALAWERQVGIDLETAASLTRSPHELPALAERIFSKNELAAWHALSDAETRTAAFLRAWTRKEACLKAAGLRLDDMAKIDVGFTAPGGPRKMIFARSRDEPPCAWTVHDLSMPIPFAGALVVEA